MYGSDDIPKIHAIHSNETETESESFINKPEWCPNSEKEISQALWINAISKDLETVAAFDPRPHGTRSVPEKPKWFYCHASSKWVDINPHLPEVIAEQPPEELPAFQAVHWEDNHLGVDLRPHLHDKKLDKFFLVDSGSQCTAVPPDPGDQPSGEFLKAVNGSKIKCFGHKVIEVKIGRKTYHYKAIKADIEQAVLGWDFMRAHKLDIVWNDFGDI